MPRAQAIVKKVLHRPTNTYLAMKVINTCGASKKELYIELERVMDSYTDRNSPYGVCAIPLGPPLDVFPVTHPVPSHRPWCQFSLSV